jgi:organic hydroperoxide reductase OsmC/OhrA
MSTYHATITWNRNGQKFTDNRYVRAHLWLFDGGAKVPASSSPHVVPLPYSDPSAVDPEEAFLASLSSCHMLWFLSIAAKKGFVVDKYKDAAEAVMGKNSEGKLAIIKVILHPVVKYSEESTPSPEENDALHHEAHEKCFIANSVLTEIRIEPRLEV